MTMSPSPAEPPGSNPPEMRASDADRDRVAHVLRESAGDGRLTLEELDERLNAVYQAKTYAELEPITRDLPKPGAGRDVAPYSPPFADTPAGSDVPTWGTSIAVMSGFERAGEWTVPQKVNAVAFWGGGKIDLREARFNTQEVRIRAFAIMGGIDVIVPDDLSVHVTGLGIMGAFDDKASGPGEAGAPRVIVSGFAFWGGVGVKRKARRAAKKLRKDMKKRDDA